MALLFHVKYTLQFFFSIRLSDASFIRTIHVSFSFVAVFSKCLVSLAGYGETSQVGGLCTVIGVIGLFCSTFTVLVHFILLFMSCVMFRTYSTASHTNKILLFIC